jgi:uncharacterized protein Yka (UPF0111/DUF47 family)
MTSIEEQRKKLSAKINQSERDFAEVSKKVEDALKEIRQLIDQMGEISGKKMPEARKQNNIKLFERLEKYYDKLQKKHYRKDKERYKLQVRMHNLNNERAKLIQQRDRLK